MGGPFIAQNRPCSARLDGDPLGAWLEGSGQVLRSTRNLIFLQGLVTADGEPAMRVSGIFKQGPLIGDGTDRDPLKLRV